jgi:hypothetical protein
LLATTSEFESLTTSRTTTGKTARSVSDTTFSSASDPGMWPTSTITAPPDTRWDRINPKNWRVNR